MRGRFCFGMQNFHNDNDSKYPHGYIYLSITLIEYKYSYFVIKKAGDVLYRLILQRLASIVGIFIGSYYRYICIDKIISYRSGVDEV